MEAEKGFDPVKEIGKSFTDSIKVLAPLFSAIYPRETVDTVKDQFTRAVVRKSTSLYRHLKSK